MNTTAQKPPVSPIFAKIQAMVSEITGIDPEDITYGMEFGELSMTPVELAEFFSRVNKEFSVRLKAADLEEYETLGILSEYIEDETD